MPDLKKFVRECEELNKNQSLIKAIPKEKSKVEFSFNPKTVREACIVLKDELENESSPVREAFKASIKSAIDEAPNYTDMDKLADRILERIVGQS